MEAMFNRYAQAGDWKAGFAAVNLTRNDAVLLAAAIIWYHGAVPIVRMNRARHYNVSSPGYAAW